MRLLTLELKRVLKTRMTQVMLCVALLISMMFAFLPVTYVYCPDPDYLNGSELHFLEGFDAVEQEKVIRQGISGEITQDKIDDFIKTYQDTLREYNAEETYDLTNEVYFEKIDPGYPLFQGIVTAYGDQSMGIYADIKNIDATNIDDYYAALIKQNEAKFMAKQGGHPSAVEFGRRMYERVAKPFAYYSGITSDAVDYETLSVLIILICLTVACAPIFSAEYQTGADNILRCTRYGRTRLAFTKIVTAMLICLVASGICMMSWLVLSTAFFGVDGMKASVQLVLAPLCLLNMDMGEFVIMSALVGILLITASVCFTLFLSAVCESNVQAMAFAMLGVFVPIFSYWMLPERVADVIKCFLPAGGIGLNNSIVFDFREYRFVNFGGLSVWTPYLTIIMAVVEIPLFICLAIRCYNRHVS